MTIYTPTKRLVGNGLDEVGLKVGLTRLKNETLSDFRRRILLEARLPSGASEQQTLSALSRRVGLFDTPVMKINLKYSGGVRVAEDPVIEITSSFFKAYSDYTNNTLDIELDLTESEGKFCREIFDALNASSYFSVTALDSAYTFKRSLNLKIETSREFVEQQFLYQNRMNDLGNKNIRLIRFSDQNAFDIEVASLSLIDQEGEYFIDRENGILHTESIQTGWVSYEYSKFPFDLIYQPVRAYPITDLDKDFRLKTKAISNETGTNEPQYLNSEGVKILNAAINKYGVTWG